MIMKKMRIFSLLLILMLALISYEKKEEYTEEYTTDALRFKEEYESLNTEKRSSDGKYHRSLSISEKNPIIYKTADEIVEKIEEKETFIVYFGFDSCPWCRSVITELLQAASDENIEKIYYVDVKEIRDILEIDENGKIKKVEEGTNGYQKLLLYLDNVLDEYTLVDADGKSIQTGEKRIYAPNVVSIVNGVATKKTSGISDKQTDSMMDLTEEIKKDSYNRFLEVIKEVQ